MHIPWHPHGFVLLCSFWWQNAWILVTYINVLSCAVYWHCGDSMNNCPSASEVTLVNLGMILLNHNHIQGASDVHNFWGGLWNFSVTSNLLPHRVFSGSTCVCVLVCGIYCGWVVWMGPLGCLQLTAFISIEVRKHVNFFVQCCNCSGDRPAFTL